MKKLFTLLVLIATISINAQAPQGFNYQATVRNSAGNLLLNQIVLVKFNILLNSSTGTIVYSESQSANTDDLGHIALVVGKGTATTGTFSTINWGNGTYYLGIELNSGTGYVAMGTTQLLSVPYALYAGNSQSKGKTSILITGNITNEQAAAQISAEFGPYTENVYIQNTTGLTTVDLSAFSSVVNLYITENSNLATINLNSLTTIYDTFIIKGNNALKTLSLPALTRIPSSLEELFIIGDNPILTSISFPALVNIFGEVEIYNNNSLTSISFPVLVNISGYLDIDRNDSLTSVIFPVLKTAQSLGIDGNSKLTSIGITSLSSYNDNDLSFDGNALPSSQINTILNKLLNITIPNLRYIGLRQIPPAPPTGQGLIDKQTLIDRGYNIYTD